MRSPRENAKGTPSDPSEREEPMSREMLDTPEMRAKIEKALERARAGRKGRGMTAEELRHLAREQRRVDPRT